MLHPDGQGIDTEMIYRVKAKLVEDKAGDFYSKLTDGTIADQDPDGKEIVDSMKRAVLNALFKNGDASTLITKFRYPVYGPGMMWERFRERVEAQGSEVRCHFPLEGGD